MIEQLGLVAVLALCCVVFLRLLMYAAFRIFGSRDQTDKSETD